MDFEALARQMMETTHPRDRRPPLGHVQKQERMQDMTLRFLLENGGSAAPKELVEFFDVSSARVTKVLGTLEERGFVVRESDCADRRRVTVRLTGAGERSVLALETAHRQRLAEVLARLGEQDAKELVRLMGRLVEIMETRCQAGNCCGKGT